MLASFSFIFLIVLGLQSHAVVGGVDTTSKSLPSYLNFDDLQKMQSHTVVVLNAQVPGTHSRCSGTLISKNVVLTAAHCVPDSLQEIYVVPATYEFVVMARKRIIKAVVHPNYKSFEIPKFNKPNWDLALVKFEGDLPEAYHPTTWINSFFPGADRFWLYVAGYGKSDTDQDDSGELRFSRVTIEKAMLTANESFMQGNQSPGEGICKGDSGGPAYIKIQNQFYVIGVVSAIVGGCRGTSYFNQTLFYQNWISETLSSL